MNTEVRCEETRIMIRRAGFDLRMVFDQMDVNQKGFLTFVEMMQFFDSYSRKQVGGMDLEGLIRRFNKDKLNGRISLPEFLDELTPKSN